MTTSPLCLEESRAESTGPTRVQHYVHETTGAMRHGAAVQPGMLRQLPAMGMFFTFVADRAMVQFIGIGLDKLARRSKSQGGAVAPAAPAPVVSVVITLADPIDSVPRLNEIRAQFSLNMSQLAQAVGVGRAALYAWYNGANVPSADNRNRIKALFDLAAEWHAVAPEPVGRHLATPLPGGRSLIDVLTADPLDSGEARQIIHQLAAHMRTEQMQTQAAAAALSQASLDPRFHTPSAELQRQRLESESRRHRPASGEDR